jgi:hypothetical protein
MITIKLSTALILIILAGQAFSQPAEIILSNTLVTVKMDITRGGAISYISKAGSERNIVNIYDEGRYVQQSYYAGKRLDRVAEGQAPRWSPWSWNPVQGGDDYRNRSKTLDYKELKDTLYAKCIPLLWDMKNTPAEAIMEQWVTLDNNVIKVHNKITCSRTDTIYGEDVPNDQELPAVYPVSALDHLYTYTGEKPYTGEPVENPEVVNISSGFWGRYPKITESWMAFADSTGWGIGVYSPLSTYFLAGMSGAPGAEYPDKSTSYIAPVKVEKLLKNSVYEYEYYLIIGSVDEIRDRIYEIHNTLKKSRQ